jgi:hypothetical protein
MCPEKQILSVYFDGELPVRFKEKVEAHLAGCARCREIVSVFAKLSKAVSSKQHDCSAALEGARLRVRDKLSLESVGGTQRGRRRGAAVSRRHFPESAILRRSVRVPLPCVAAAGVIILCAVAMLGYQFSGFVRGERADTLARYADDDEPDALYYNELSSSLEAANMDDVLRYVEGNNSDIVSIKLPASKNFKRFGEPKLINASDYPRRRIGQ